MKIQLRNDPENRRVAIIHTRNGKTGADGQTLELQPDDVGEIEITDDDHLVVRAGAYVEGVDTHDHRDLVLSGPTLLGGPSYAATLASNIGGEPFLSTPNAGSPEEIAARVDVDGHPAPSPSYLGGPTMFEREAIAAAEPKVEAPVHSAEELVDANAEIARQAAEGLSVDGERISAAAITADRIVNGDTQPGGNAADTVAREADAFRQEYNADDSTTAGADGDDTLMGGQGDDTMISGDPAIDPPNVHLGEADGDSVRGEADSLAGGEESTAGGSQGADELKDIDDETLVTVMLGLNSGPSVERTEAGYIKVPTINEALAAQGYKPIDAARRTAVQDAKLPPQP